MRWLIFLYSEAVFRYIPKIERFCWRFIDGDLLVCHHNLLDIRNNQTRLKANDFSSRSNAFCSAWMSISTAFPLKSRAQSRDKSRHVVTHCHSMTQHYGMSYSIYVVCVSTLNIQIFHVLYDGSVTRCNANNSLVCLYVIYRINDDTRSLTLPEKEKKQKKNTKLWLCVSFVDYLFIFDSWWKRIFIFARKPIVGGLF